MAAENIGATGRALWAVVSEDIRRVDLVTRQGVAMRKQALGLVYAGHLDEHCFEDAGGQDPAHS